MGASFESQSWYRAAHLTPRLAERAEISRQIFRGVPWFVVRDPVTGKFHRLSEAAYAVFALMDGERPIGEIWDIACAELGDHAPSQDELLSIVSQLNMLDLLHTDGLPDAEEIARRGRRLSRRGFLGRFINPLAIRIPIFDPNTLLDETWPLARPFFSILGGIAYLALLVAGLVTAGRHWESLTGNLIDRVLATESLIILVLVYPFVKVLHELGHGYAVKKWGGEVREVGIIFLVFIPIPYVDASAASGFPGKWARILVGAAGILVEVGLAAVAMLVWTELGEGVWRAVAFNVMLIGGVSTLLFNGNPLLRFDGYYVLADLLEIPNLGVRSNRYLGYLLQHHLFGIKEARSPVRAPGEAKWFFFYSIAAFAYRIIISIAIITLVATKFLAIGVLLAIWAVSLMFVLPILKHLRFLFFSETLRGLRARALAVFGLALSTLVFLFAFVPVPYRTVAQGVVFAPEQAAVFASEDGQVAQVIATANSNVTAGTPILRLEDPFAEMQLRVAEAEAQKLNRRYQQAFAESAFDLRLWRVQAARAESEVQLLRERIASLVLHSPRSGVLILPHQADLPGRYLRKGDVVGYVIAPEDLVVRVAVSQDTADLIRRHTTAVDVRTAERLAWRQPGRIVREVPTVGGLLPSMALTSEGGGPFPLDPKSRDQPRSLEPVMQFEIVTDEPLPTIALGSRVYVRFDHGSQPIAERVWRRLRQIFLRRFNV